MVSQHQPCIALALAAVCQRCCLDARPGRLPFHAEGVLGLYEAIRSAPLEQPSEVAASAPLRSLLTALLAKDPACRPSLAAMAVHTWVTHAGATPLAIPLVQARLCRAVLAWSGQGW